MCHPWLAACVTGFLAVQVARELGPVFLGAPPDGAAETGFLGLMCGVAYAHGWLFTAGWVLLACGTLDVLDGAMARRRGAAGPRGAFMDSVVDRYGEAVVFMGLAAWYRDGWQLWVVIAAWFGAVMVSYTRARAEALGVDCRGGLMQRPERYVTLGGASLFAALIAHLTCAPAVGRAILTAGTLTVAALANATAIQRVRFALRRLA
jgi:phosphatidylglycerophosphate synthase